MADVVVAREDRVTVTDWRPVQGLERRVVVELADWRQDDDVVVDIYRMYAVSRCTTQLITVNMPQRQRQRQHRRQLHLQRRQHRQ